ncbi:MAG: TIR domain-containing protein [Planctomycetota bacterium]
MTTTARIFCAFSHADAGDRDTLHRELGQADGITWHERRVGPNDDWRGQVAPELSEADVVLVLVSADLMSSGYAADAELKLAVERQTSGATRVVPVLLHAVDWGAAPFAMLPSLPASGGPVHEHEDAEAALREVAKAVQASLGSGAQAPQPTSGMPRPEFELGEYKGMAFERQPVSVTDQEVQAALEDVRLQNVRSYRAPEGGLPPSGVAVCDLEIFIPGRDQAVARNEGAQLWPDSPPEGVDAAAYAEQVPGVEEGTELTLPMRLPEGSPIGYAGDATLKAHVREVHRLVMPTDAQLLEALKVASGGELIERLRNTLKTTKDAQENARIETELLERLIDAHPFELPTRLIEERTNARAAEAHRQLVAQGMPEATAQGQIARQLDQLRAATEKGLRAVFLMERIAEREGFQITGQEIEAELASIAARSQKPLEEVRSFYAANGMVNGLALQLLEQRTRRFLRESAEESTPEAAG